MLGPGMDPSPFEDASPVEGESTEAATSSTEELFEELYRNLRAMAERLMVHERGDHTLQATALVHEVYLRLQRQEEAAWEERGRFLGIAARTMRRALCDHARARLTLRRGSGERAAEQSVDELEQPTRSAELVALDEALEQLAAIDERQAQVVELRYFGGLTIPEVASALGVSARTVDGEWAMARAWLQRRVG